MSEDKKIEKPKVDIKVIREIEADKKKQLATHEIINK